MMDALAPFALEAGRKYLVHDPIVHRNGGNVGVFHSTPSNIFCISRTPPLL